MHYLTGMQGSLVDMGPRLPSLPLGFWRKGMPALTTQDKPGYHLAKIAKGELGELSKVKEEIEEALDAQDQKAEVMVLVELSDAIGAIEAYLARHHPTISIEDLLRMAAITKRAFDHGRR